MNEKLIESFSIAATDPSKYTNYHVTLGDGELIFKHDGKIEIKNLDFDEAAQKFVDHLKVLWEEQRPKWGQA